TTFNIDTVTDAVGAGASVMMVTRGTGTAVGAIAWGGTAMRMGGGSVSAPAWSFSSNTNYGMYVTGSARLGFSFGGALLLELSGVGVTIPTGGFTVTAGGGTFASNVNVTGFVRAQGTSGYLEITDGITAPGTGAGGRIYIDTADGDLKIKF